MDAGRVVQRGHAARDPRRARSRASCATSWRRRCRERAPLTLLGFLAERRAELLALTGQHLVLVLVATAIAVAVGLPLGIALTRAAAPGPAAPGPGRPAPDDPQPGPLRLPDPAALRRRHRRAHRDRRARALRAAARSCATPTPASGRWTPRCVEAATGLGMTDGQRLRHGRAAAGPARDPGRRAHRGRGLGRAPPPSRPPSARAAWAPTSSAASPPWTRA